MKPIASTALALVLGLALPLAAQPASPGAHFIENWDADGDGKVSLAEASEKRADLFTMFDQDEDDVLSSGEYDAFDETRAEDLANNAEAHGGMGKGKGAGQGVDLGDHVRSLDRGFADADGDGTVSRAEFEGISATWFAQRDRDGDGYITTADFGPRG
ncbi:hypothetical protein [Vannielia litorea]|uniref:EF hand n=1 Tax=Vannielia litorea TaxID=1217970 RepID=A0A1N6GEB9_9RHOB|nr:hypothetical protein [Vannielia litorea]SIO05851.1 EF hand [Vannielia litorea]